MKNENKNQKRDLKSRTYAFAIGIIKFIDTLNQRDLSVQVMSKQVLRSATGVGANVIEAQAGSSKKDFTNFYHHALKSANETKFWLGLLYEANKCDQTKAEPLIEEITELANILAASILTLKSNN